jgi:dTDP-4-dehydrorhamnose reductase
MKILVLGSKGQLGLCLADELILTHHNVVFTSRAEIDVSFFDATRQSITVFNPDVVINATAYTAVDKAEYNNETAYLINHLAVSKLADICNELKCWLIHISTDYVFDGNSTRPYVETDTTSPQCVYGHSKLNGEKAIQASGCKFLIIRTAWVFSEYGSNFFKTMLRLATQRDSINIVADQIGCPTYARDIAKAILCTLPFIGIDLASNVYHYAGNQSCSWAKLAERIFNEAKAMGKLQKIPHVISIASKDYPTPAKRPMNSRLDSSRFVAKFGCDASDLKAGVISAVKSWN